MISILFLLEELWMYLKLISLSYTNQENSRYSHKTDIPNTARVQIVRCNVILNYFGIYFVPYRNE